MGFASSNHQLLPGLFLLPLVILVGLPALVVWVAMNLFRGSGRNAPPPGPEQILKERLARGEIDTDEYQRLQGFIRSDR
jgi:uncharacterized membrane protein